MLKGLLVGNIGGEPEMRYSSSGSPFLRFNVASNGRRREQSGEWVDTTEWVRCTVFGKRAESLQTILKRGMRVYVDGRIEARPWTDQQGNVRAGLEILASDVELMQSRDTNARPAGDDDGDDAF